MLSGSKPLPEPMLTHAYCLHMASLGKNGLIVVLPDGTKQLLEPCLLSPYGVTRQEWVNCGVAWWYQAITWTKVD